MARQIFFHIPGRSNAQRDFPRTVWQEVPIPLIAAALPEDLPEKVAIVQTLNSTFPEGKVNCWGAPAGAISTMRYMKPGDYVILLETFAANNDICALGCVSAFWPLELPELSRVLWGESYFPYIFFFKASPISLEWKTLKQILGYSAKYRTSDFVLVAPDRVERLGGAMEIIGQILCMENIVDPDSMEEDWEEFHLYNPSASLVEWSQDFKNLVGFDYPDDPPLIESQIMVTSSREIALRKKRFRFDVEKLYQGHCAMCGSRVVSPMGKFEGNAAHIYPKSKGGIDDPRNGIFLCRIHHWAFDFGMLSVSNDFTILTYDAPPDKNYDFIRNIAGKKLRPPTVSWMSPLPKFLTAHRKLFGF